MKKIFSATLLTAVFLAGAIVTAQETPRPASPPGHAGPMAGMMGEGGAMKSPDLMRAMMERMRGMPGMEGMTETEMMEHCRQMMAGAQGTAPNGSKQHHDGHAK
jgi:hypothetical protein